MIVPIYPPFDGEAAERFHEFATKLACAQRVCRTEDMLRALEAEMSWCHSAQGFGEKRLAYEACVRVLLDLARLRWRIVEQAHGFALEKRRERVGRRPTAEIIDSKKTLRNELQPVVEEQRCQPAVLKFIHRMEADGRLGRRSVRLLMTDGAELAARLAPARSLEDGDRMAVLNDAIRPYLQEADRSEDPTTGHQLREIWRYFRYSWSIPQVPTPGRQLLYLVRDGAHPAHPVMGIASLNNCPLEMGERRERYIGWHFTSIVERFGSAVRRGKAALEEEVRWLERQLATSLAEIDWTNLVTAEEVEAPEDCVIQRLALRGQQFSASRETLLRKVAGSTREAFETDFRDDETAPPVDDDILKLEAKASVDERMHAARKHLVAKKRASGLSRLLLARRVIAQYRGELADPGFALAALEKDEVRSAINIVLEALKGRRAGANLLEITTCGAIAPYNRILGGKLVALLMLSPQIAADYRRRYSEPSIISSQMKNRLVTRDNSLVYLGTTSLYAHGSSQYNRLHLPAGTIAPNQETIRYNAIGQTSGFGTVQFSSATSTAIERYLAHDEQFKEVNSVFGEGTSPKLRKLRMGLRKLGFDPHKLTQHRHHRLIYAVPLFPMAREWLQERTVELPDYVAVSGDCTDATERIVSYWRRRWLASRLHHRASMAALPQDSFVPLGENGKQVAGEMRA